MITVGNPGTTDLTPSERKECRRCGAPATCRVAWRAHEVALVLGPPEAAGVSGPWCAECGRTVAAELEARVGTLIRAFKTSRDVDAAVEVQALERAAFA